MLHFCVLCLSFFLQIRVLSKLGVSRFARKYPGVKDTLLRALLELACRYERTLAGEAEAKEEREKDQYGNVFKTAAELLKEEERKRLVRSGKAVVEEVREEWEPCTYMCAGKVAHICARHCSRARRRRLHRCGLTDCTAACAHRCCPHVVYRHPHRSRTAATLLPSHVTPTFHF